MSMLPDQFRRDKARVKAAAELLAGPVMRDILQSMMEGNPANYPMPKLGSTPSDHSRNLGLIEGHWYALQLLKSYGVLLEDKPLLRSEFTGK